MGVDNRVNGGQTDAAEAERARREAEAAAERARQEAERIRQEAERVRREAEERARVAEQQAQRQCTQSEPFNRLFAERLGLDPTLSGNLLQMRLDGDGNGTTPTPTTVNGNDPTTTSSAQTLSTNGQVTPESPTPEELQATEGLRRVQQANDEARRVWDTLPPDARRVELNTGTGVSLFDQWREAAHSALGPGNAEKLNEFFDDNRESLDSLGRIITGAPGSGDDVSREQALAERLYAPAITALRQQHPNASFELVALRDNTLQEWQQPSTTRSEIVIAMTQTGTDGQAQTPHYSLDTRFLANQNSDHGAFVQALEQSGTTEQWRERMRTHDTNAFNWFEISPDAANNERALSHFGTTTGMEAIQRMEPQQQAAFFTAYAQRAPQAFETMLRPVEITADQTVVRADANHLTGTERPTTINSTVNISGAGTDKLRNFTDQNYQTLVAPTFAQYLNLRGDAPRELSGTALTNEIGLAMNLPPNNAPQTPADEAQLNNGTWSFYTGDAREAINPVEEAIREVGGENARVTVLPVMFDSEELSLQQIPLFRVQAEDGSDRFVDTSGRTYDNLDDWRDNNKLPAGRISYPANGHLTAGSDGRAQIVTENSHAVKDHWWEHVTPVLDVVATVGGIIAGGAIIIGSGGTAAPFVLGAASLWAGGRAAQGLHDRASHGQTLSPLDSEARNQWINLGASVLGVGALGAGMRVAGAASRGANVSASFLRMTRALTVGAQYADTAATVDGSVNLALNWDRMSPQDRMLAIGQIGFWGVSTGVQARQAGGLSNLYSGREVNDFMRQTSEEVRSTPPRGYGVETVTLSDGTTMETLRQVRATDDGVETQWGTVPGRIVGEYDTMRPGPLGDTQNSPAATFSGGRYVAIELDQPVTLYRAYAPETSRELGGFWSQTKPQGMLQTQIDAALRPEWGQMQDAPWRVQATRWVEVEVPAGTRIFVGEVANQSFIDPNTGQGGVWVGGTSQVMIEGGPQAAWVRGGGSLTGETPAYSPARRTDAELQTDTDATLRTGETQQQSNYRVRAAQAEIELRAVMQTYNGLGDTPPRINIAANDVAHPDDAHTLDRHGASVPLRRTDAPVGQRTIEGRIYGDQGWPGSAQNYSYRWIDDATMNRTVNDYVQSNWNQIRSELALSENGTFEATFDSGHLVGEGYYNSGQTGVGPRQAVPHQTSFVTITLEMIPGNPPSFFVVRAFPAGRGY